MALAVVGCVVFCVPSPVSAIPTLQLWSPQGIYDAESESWRVAIEAGSSFELQVLAAQAPEKIHVVDRAWLLVAIPNSSWRDDLNPSLTVKTLQVASDPNPLAPQTLTLGAEDLHYGNPGQLGIFKGGKVPWHGTYPAHYWAISLDGTFSHADGTPATFDVSDYPGVIGAGETILNYNPGDIGSDNGDIQYYEISWQPGGTDFFLHFDAIGYAHNGQAKWVFAPFSHDAYAVHAPEPGTLALVGFGLAAVGFRLVGRRHRRA